MGALLVSRTALAPNVVLYEVEAPRIARKHKAGQFVIVRPLATSERIPLTIADSDAEKGTITLVVQAVGKTTEEMATKVFEGDELVSVAGPLGNPTHLSLPNRGENELGTVVCVAGGIGAAPILPIAKAFREAGHEVVTVLGARNQSLLILEDRLAAASDRVIVTTDDGSRGRKGFVSEALAGFVAERRLRGGEVDLVIAIGPAPMMRASAEVARSLAIPALVSLNTIMVDGTGMCGGCRVTVGNAVKYVCVDGPEFDGALVDWEALMRRQAMYKTEEKESLERYRTACEMERLEAMAEGEAENDKEACA
jgi:ferredoxin/flavodoxin---NADP+ reductase